MGCKIIFIIGFCLVRKELIILVKKISPTGRATKANSKFEIRTIGPTINNVR